uniref:SET domain-containing protein n=1 Tax=Trichuris muris TaxID=70415 RepID=A0A5S6QKA7_TRIMR
MRTHARKGRRGFKKTSLNSSHTTGVGAKHGMLKYFTVVSEKCEAYVSTKEEVYASVQNGSETEGKDLQSEAECQEAHTQSPVKTSELVKGTTYCSPRKLGGRERNGEISLLKSSKELKKSSKGDEQNGVVPSSRTVGTPLKTVAVSSEKVNGDHKEKSASTSAECSSRRRKGITGRKGTRDVCNSPAGIETTTWKAGKSTKQTNKITSYFSTRKSERLTESQIKGKNLELLKRAVLTCCEDSLNVKQFEGKGRGVVAARDFEKALKREKSYQNDSSIGCYMYYFTYRDKHYCVDATEETEYKARLINHSAKEPNCVPKIIEVNDRPCIVLIASRNVRVGEELLYNYGDRSRAAVAANPWLVNS